MFILLLLLLWLILLLLLLLLFEIFHDAPRLRRGTEGKKDVFTLPFFVVVVVVVVATTGSGDGI